MILFIKNSINSFFYDFFVCKLTAFCKGLSTLVFFAHEKGTLSIIVDKCKPHIWLMKS